MIRPTEGRITTKYGFREHPITHKMDFHAAIDIGFVSTNDEILAVDDAVVKYKMFDPGGYGYYLVLEHDGYCSLYAHLRDRVVNIGDKVTKGQKIAVKGTSGSSTGVHLHFEIRECPYSKFWERFYNREWRYAVDPEKFYLERGFNLNDKKETWKTEIGIKAINELNKKGKLTNPEMHIKNLEKESVQPWLFWEMLNRLND